MKKKPTTETCSLSVPELVFVIVSSPVGDTWDTMLLSYPTSVPAPPRKLTTAWAVPLVPDPSIFSVPVAAGDETTTSWATSLTPVTGRPALPVTWKVTLELAATCVPLLAVPYTTTLLMGAYSAPTVVVAGGMKYPRLYRVMSTAALPSLAMVTRPDDDKDR